MRRSLLLLIAVFAFVNTFSHAYPRCDQPPSTGPAANPPHHLKRPRHPKSPPALKLIRPRKPPKPPVVQNTPPPPPPPYIVPPPPPTNMTPPPPAALTCPDDGVKLDTCVDVLGGLVHIGIGNAAKDACCPVLGELLGLDAAVCICTKIKARLLNINVVIPIALQLLIDCGNAPPPGFHCPP